MQILSGAASNRAKSFNDRLAAETEYRYVQISKQIFEDKGIPIRRIKWPELPYHMFPVMREYGQRRSI